MNYDASRSHCLGMAMRILLLNTTLAGMLLWCLLLAVPV